MNSCPLCLSHDRSIKHKKLSGEVYWDCLNCRLIYLDSVHHLSPEKEKAHYETHNNDVTDPRYQKFVSPIVEFVQEHFTKGAIGLDFGAGPGPVIATMLTERGFSMKVFDPYYWNDHTALTYRYDFIAASEVIEHFYNPAQEFDKLKFLLNHEGKLILMTEIYHDRIDFAGWYYHKDPTHVCFYREETFHWLASRYSFKGPDFISSRAVALSN